MSTSSASPLRAGPTRPAWSDRTFPRRRTGRGGVVAPGASRRSWLQPMAPSRVRCRPGTSRGSGARGGGGGRPGGRGSRPSGSSETRAAASSMPSGRPSRRAQMASTASSVRPRIPARPHPAGPLDEEASGRIAVDPSTASAAVAPVCIASGRTGYSCSPWIRSGARLVTTTFESGRGPQQPRRRRRPHRGGARSCRGPGASTDRQGMATGRSAAGRSGPSKRPSDPRDHAADLCRARRSRRGPRTRRRPGIDAAWPRASSTARLVLPMPPGPVSVIRRPPSSS